MLDNIIIAHRGESFDAPENTIAAINLAWSRNARSVEIDIHLTKDQQIVVIHDRDTKRVFGKKLVVKHSTLNELQRLKIGTQTTDLWVNEKIPTLAEVIQTVPSNGRLIIEIKSDALILEKLREVLALSKLKPSQIMIIAFNLNTLAKAKQLMPEYKMLWLLDLDYTWPHWLLFINQQNIIKKVIKRHIDGVDVWAGKILNCNFIDTFHKAGLEVLCWTVDEPSKAEKLIKCGIDGITTNRAHWLTQQIKVKWQ